MVCALKELGSLFQSLSATASPLIQEPSVGETSRFIYMLTTLNLVVPTYLPTYDLLKQ